MFLLEDFNRPIHLNIPNKNNEIEDLIPTRYNPIDCHSEFKYYSNYLTKSKFSDAKPWMELEFKDNAPFKNFYWPSSFITDYTSLAKKYPDFKHINITVNSDERLFVDINHHLKAFSTSHAFKHFSDYFNLNDFNDFNESLRNLTPAQLDEIKQYNIKFNDNLSTMDHNKVMEFYNNNLNDNIFFINFFDIINDPYKVLHILSKVTDRPITYIIEKAYYDYIINQLEFYEKYVPWYPFLNKENNFIIDFRNKYPTA